MKAKNKQPAAILKQEKKPSSEQAVVNIGIVGHVDHGKCIALEEPILLNNDLSTGKDLVLEKCSKTIPEKVSESETIFDVPNLRAFSLDPGFGMVSVPAKVFLQNYSGQMIEILTKDGKRLKASPEHPLLSNNGGEIAWAKAKDLKEGQFIGALKSLPENAFLKDPFSGWAEELQKTCWVVTSERARELQKKTNDFSEFNSISITEMNEVRILKKISCNSLDKKCGINPGYFSASVKNSRISEKNMKKIIEFFKSTKTLLHEGIIANYRKNSKSFAEIKSVSFANDDMLGFLAFIIAEGHITENSIRIAQSENTLLDNFFDVCTKNFGIKPRQYGPIDYHINNKALVDFLKARYGILTGASRKAGIPWWVFSLPNHKLKLFLRTFFSAEGSVNEKSNQIALVQANNDSICLIGYCLKKFGISHSIHSIDKTATNSAKKTKRTYWQLLISGIGNAQKFSEMIGFELKEKQEKLEKICSRKEMGKTTDHMVPLEFTQLSQLVELLGLKKDNYSRGKKALKQRPWFFSYQDCSYKNTISEKKLKELILSLHKRLGEMEQQPIKKISLGTLSEWGITMGALSKKSGLSKKMVFQAMHSTTKKEAALRKELIIQAIKIILKNRVEKAKEILGRIVSNSPKNIEWCKIKSIKTTNYQGPIIDLQVPGYHNFVCGTGGLVSHNTSLTQALTSKWTDTHSEELKRGISIKLGYAEATFYACSHGKETHCTSTPDCQQQKGKPEKTRTVSFIDAPGHETLMTTMLTGASLMHGAVLVVAANETCPQPQTEEHLMALRVSGIENVVVAQNKIDLVDRQQALKNHSEISALLKKYEYDNAPIVPIAANLNANIGLLIEAIEKTIPTPVFESNKPLKMYCSRSFDVNKPGTAIEQIKGGVLGGSIVQGKVRVGDSVEIVPGIDGKKVLTRIASLATEKTPLEEAMPGGLIALGTTLDPSITQSDGMRGQVVGAVNSLPEPSTRAVFEINYLERLVGEKSQGIKANEPLVLTIGTATLIGMPLIKSKNIVEINLNMPAIMEQGQKIAISKKTGNRWRLVAFGVIK